MRKIEDTDMRAAALLISEACYERQDCNACALYLICKHTNRSRPPMDWHKILTGKKREP